MIRLLLFAAISRLLISPYGAIASGVPGTWKRTAMTLVDGNGKTTDMAQMLGRTMPCMKDIIYTFTSDGHTKSTVPDACGRLKESIEHMNTEGTWTVSGHKLTVTSATKAAPPALYDISFQGNMMTWVFNYAANPMTPNPTHAQRLTIVYQQL